MASLQLLNEAGDSNPPGTIVIFTGFIADIPPGWTLCDGTLGTPDLREKFVREVPTATDPGATGGVPTVQITTGTMPSHTHSLSGQSHRHNYPISETDSGGSEFIVIGGNDASQTALDINDTELVKAVDPIQFQGGDGLHNNIPTFFGVLFIQRL